jgi:hypothetical protein
MEHRSTFQAFSSSPYFSIKHTNYFDIYDKLLTKYVGQEITLVEIGILDGGSLFMWREFFGKHVRIIGVELNPEAIKWREHGFEIHIGDQSDPSFWGSFFQQVGDIDVLLDDGGHRNDQQIVTVKSSLPHIRDGGIILVEDTQTSFVKFESFQKFSFVSFLKGKIRSLYSRSEEVRVESDLFSKSVHSIEFFTGVCALHINRELCMDTQRIENCGMKSNQSDFRYNNDGKLQAVLRSSYDWISWDYPSVERTKRYPRISRALQVNVIRKLLRLFIIPLRSLIYLFLQLSNWKKLRKYW